MKEQNYWQRATARSFSRRTMLRSLAYGGAGIAAAALLGCGSKPKPATSTSGASGTSAAQPKTGGNLTMWQTSDIFNLDLTTIGQSGPNSSSEDLAYESLLGFQYTKNPYETTLVPKLAEKWETPDAQTYTFQLRKGVKFANIAPVNGRDMTSADWKFSLGYAARFGSQFSKLTPAIYAWLLAGLDRIDTPDDYTLVVHFSSPYAPFLNYCAGERLQGLAHEIYDQYGNFKDNMVGTGAFQLDQAASQKGTRWVFKKNPTYWDSGKPYLDSITKIIVPDNQTAFAALQAGQIDTLYGGGTLAATDFKAIKASNPTAVATDYPALPPLHLYTNMVNGPTSNLAVRRALSLSMSRQEFVDTFSNGLGLWAVPGAFPDTFSQDEIKKMTYMKYDVQAAKQQLAAGGFSDGVDIEFLVNSAYGQEYLNEAQLLQSQWAKAGIRLKLTVMSDYNEYLARTRGGPGENYQMTMRGKALEPDIDSYLYMIYAPDGGIEGQPYPNDTKLPALVKAQRQEADPNKRHDLERQACEYIADQCWHLAIFRDAVYQVQRPNVQNMQVVWGMPDWPKQTWLSA
jgi:peptide/nickel transport system substrate-binding protein